LFPYELDVIHRDVFALEFKETNFTLEKEDIFLFAPSPHNERVKWQTISEQGLPTNRNSLLGSVPLGRQPATGGAKLRVDPQVFFLVSDPQTISSRMKQSK
jgi:hypothetical protein